MGYTPVIPNKSTENIT